MDRIYRDGDEGDPDPTAEPGVHPRAAGRPAEPLTTLEVDGELFALHHDGSGTAYTWLSGPNVGYGFGSSGPPDQSVDAHRESIRTFLSMVDPTTGHIEDD